MQISELLCRDEYIMRASSHPFRGARAFVARSFHPLPFPRFCYAQPAALIYRFATLRDRSFELI